MLKNCTVEFLGTSEVAFFYTPCIQRYTRLYDTIQEYTTLTTQSLHNNIQGYTTLYTTI